MTFIIEFFGKTTQLKQLFGIGLSLAVIGACARSSDNGDGVDDSGSPDTDADSDTDTDSDIDADSDTDTATDTTTSGETQMAIDVAYTPPEGGDDGMALMDLYYVPDGQPKKLVVFVHGGSWVSGDKANLAEATDFVPWFIERDYVVAALNFRLASPLGTPKEVTYAEQATDIAYALAWLTDKGADYGIAASQALLFGYSSGAHLVALLAADEQYLELAGLSHEDLAASISFDVHAYDVPYALELMQGSELAMNIPLIEHLFGETENEQRIGSPSTYAESAAVPPSLLVSVQPSDKEGTHGYIASNATRSYAELLTAAGHEATFVHFDNENHASLILDFGTTGDGPTETVATFLNELD
ncbi:MAG: alpha/beta hydrolase [Deltaproteobacteria bacterium]|nr:alpha/beta hydrolase [Deltaproteobacteria bacterium]